MTASREWLTQLLTPLAGRLEKVHPNWISTLSLIAGLAAGVAYAASARHPVLYLLGGALVGASGLLDGLDGVVARLHGKESAFGDFLDHYFDRLVNIAILVGLSFSPGGSASLGLGVTILVLLNSYLGTQIHASFGARDYTGLGKGQLFVGLVVISAALSIIPDAGWHMGGHEMTLVRAFFWLVGLLSLQAMVHRICLAYRLARNDNR